MRHLENKKKHRLTVLEIVVAATLLSAPTRPLSRTAAARSSRDGAAVEVGGRPASWRLSSIAQWISARNSAVRSP